MSPNHHHQTSAFSSPVSRQGLAAPWVLAHRWWRHDNGSFAVRAASCCCCLLTACQSLPTQTQTLMPPPSAMFAAVPIKPLPLPNNGSALTPASSALAATNTSTTAATNLEEKALLQAPDLWGRLRRGFAMPLLTHELVITHARRFAVSGFLATRAERIRLYLPLLVDELEQRQLPLELALLPMVESALNPQARSPVGALGLWQFMSPTARRFELRTSSLVDDRKNLREATRAAADYLQKLYAQFGDWHLAMAAYNWGEGNVGRTVARQRERGLPVDFNALAPHLPAETRNYVPQIMALARLVAAPALFGAVLPEAAPQSSLVEVALSSDTDLALLLRLSGLSQKEFLLLNPAVKPPLVLAAATPRLLLPEPAAQRYATALALHQGRTATWSVQRLQLGQPIEALAKQQGLSTQDIRAANGIPRGMRATPGSVLLLPLAAPAGSSAAAHLVADASFNLTPDLVRLQTRVRAKESLAQVALRCGVAPQQLAEWNGLKFASGKSHGKNSKGVQPRLPAGRSLHFWLLRERAEAVVVAEALLKKEPARRPSALPAGSFKARSRAG